MDHQDVPDPHLIAQLAKLRETSPRDPHAAAATRVAFLTEARNAARGVSPRLHQRLNKWMAAITTFLAAPGKDKRPMFGTVLTLLVVLGLAFGGGTVAAAQTRMPDDALYQVKLWSEDTRISISTDQETQFHLALRFAARRMEEIQTMLQMGETPADPVMTRLQNQLERALRLAVNLPVEQLQPALLQVQTHLQQHDLAMSQLQLQQGVDPVLLRTGDRVRMLLQQQLQLCQAGIENPEELREQLRIRQQDQNQQQLQDGLQDQYQDSEQEQDQNQYQGELNREQQGELNQNQNQQGESNQNQNQDQNGPNDETPAIDSAEHPSPGTSNDPGDGTCPNCPAGDCECDGSGQKDPGGNGNKP